MAGTDYSGSRNEHFQSGAQSGSSLEQQGAQQTATGIQAAKSPHSVLTPMLNVMNPLNGRSPEFAAETAGGTRPDMNGMSQSTHDIKTMGPYQGPSAIV